MSSPRFLALVCATVLLAGCDGAAPDSAATTSSSSNSETAVGSYARGLVSWEGRAQSTVLDDASFMAGVRAGIADDDPQYSATKKCRPDWLRWENSRWVCYERCD